MHAVRNTCRPKHQVLILKCYPKFQKNNVEVKPNGSELSYLLYYASTRRSKLQKVGDFLDKRTASDVWNNRIGNVQVTLQIVKALIEKTPRDLPLYAAAVVRILRTILRSDDVTMVELSVPTFETFASHQDPATLAADQDYIRQYEDIVRHYAACADRDTPIQTKAPLTPPVAVRFRKAGLQAIKSVASSEALNSETGRQLAVIVPVILQNVYADRGHHLRLLEEREEEQEEQEKEAAYRRRQSISTVRTVDQGDNDAADAVAAAGTTEDADKMAEEEVGVIALQCLRQIFRAVNRSQIRLATSAALSFIAKRIRLHEHFPPENPENGHLAAGDSWPTVLFGMMSEWAPVQDRFIILVTLTETLIRSPVEEAVLETQLVVAKIVGWLLSSPINFIGLSVMDVLIGLVRHTLILLQLGDGNIPLKTQTVESITDGVAESKEASAISSLVHSVSKEIVRTPSNTRFELLDELQRCMANLATHIYYTDQISDMMYAILARLKPNPASDVPSTAAAIENPAKAADTLAESANIQEKPHTANFFSFDTARLRALFVVKDILVIANSKGDKGVSSAVGRSPVPVSVWAGTQWLLRDPSWDVRKAYVDALLYWLNRELKKSDLRIPEAATDGSGDEKKESGKTGGALTKHAISNASSVRNRSPKRRRRSRSVYLQLLHLAIYENAHQFASSESDILLLHLLLHALIFKLGVNSIRSGLPMIMRLQEDIQTVDDPNEKVNIGSLVHGYLWTLSLAMDFETSSAGREIHAEIARRNSKGMWLKSIRVPPIALDRIPPPAESAPGNQSQGGKLPSETVMTEALRPFDARVALVDRIAEGYESSLSSPPSSPPGSPPRQYSVPKLTTTTSFSSSSPPQIRGGDIGSGGKGTSSAMSQPVQLPLAVKDQLLSDWTKEACVAATAPHDGSRSASLSGSRTQGSASGSRAGGGLLGVSIPGGITGGTTTVPGAGAGTATARRSHSRSRPASAAAYSPRRTSASATPLSSSSVRSAVRVEDLKRALSSSSLNTPRPIFSSHSHRRGGTGPGAWRPLSSAAESVDGLGSGTASGGFGDAPGSSAPNGSSSAPTSPTSPSSPTSQTHAAAAASAARSPGAVPPVPPLPAGLAPSAASAAGATRAVSAGTGKSVVVGQGNGSVRGRKGGSWRVGAGGGGGGGATAGGRPDFSGLLDAIDVGDSSGSEERSLSGGGVGGLKGPGSPPY
ncbi:hypothetical protein BDY21DRAFT_323775 [Lineolata rhizophorae]|uniref:Protein efr3 n=1 Tax=Lineolata rhizophorae TaxID=578093 RepID=A0A6A6NWV2_9PEZI|nr:hypothetical protein BDY21DRAFT_323775 [Lineolata rhizophorae]